MADTATTPPRDTSAACLTCRAKHKKCDRQRPQCARCAEEGSQCSYQRSRRGGLTRDALARRARQRQSTDSSSSQPRHIAPSVPIPSTEQRSTQSHGSASRLWQTTQQSQYGIQTTSKAAGQSAHSTTISTPQSIRSSTHPDSDLWSYYDTFHEHHPFMLPRAYIRSSYGLLSQEDAPATAIAAMRLIGNLYAKSAWSPVLEYDVKQRLLTVKEPSPWLVQAKILYAIALYWQGDKSQAKRHLDNAIDMVKQLGMHDRAFSSRGSGGDHVLAESWRRTWWQVYITDAYYEGTTGSTEFKLADLNITTDLPCDEDAYESCSIPVPTTLLEFDNREYIPQARFSSFAYLIGATRCAVFARWSIYRAPSKIEEQAALQHSDGQLDGWLLWLPKDDRGNDIRAQEDVLLLQASLLVHVARISLHRPYSTLLFNEDEGEQDCAGQRPADGLNDGADNPHTRAILQAARAQFRLVSGIEKATQYTPYMTCMLGEGILALLSACRHILNESEVTEARVQLRVVLGFLERLGQLWPQTVSVVNGLQGVARHAFGLQHLVRTTDTQASNGTAISSSIEPGFADIMADFDRWLDLDQLEANLSWWCGD